VWASGGQRETFEKVSLKILQTFPCATGRDAPVSRPVAPVKMFKKKILIENATNIFLHDTRRRRKRSSAFGADMKDFERDFKGKLFQKFSLNP